MATERYLAVGTSGEIQHLPGMQHSKIIAATNSGEETLLFHVADPLEALPGLKSSL
ncbi:hypothetical protein [Aestuariirhabdus sp. LZHN29]|uniref:hypothetical protein n=1 Tax=Aestuariirhabdus sp. LZHN29 TaxID=3417462 RepID=UPI003CF6295F